MERSRDRWRRLCRQRAGSEAPRSGAQGHRARPLSLRRQALRAAAPEIPPFREVKGDLRDPEKVRDAMRGCNAVIHLACISNDPSFELDPELGKSINYDAFCPLVRAAKAAGVERFIYASSSSVYGVKDDPEVTEELTLEPLTDYSKFKAICETGARRRARAGLRHLHGAARHGVRLRSAPAARRRRQHPHQPGG